MGLGALRVHTHLDAKLGGKHLTQEELDTTLEQELDECITYVDDLMMCLQKIKSTDQIKAVLLSKAHE